MKLSSISLADFQQLLGANVLAGILCIIAYYNPGVEMWYLRLCSFLGGMILIPITLSAVFPEKKTRLTAISYWGAGEYNDPPDDYLGNLGYWLFLSLLFSYSAITLKYFPVWGYLFIISAIISITTTIYRLKRL
jgi:hypothetical protein